MGVTGGIATGKTTVSGMLEALGAPLIDFDILAREVVMPGTPALAQIAACFGRQVLARDGSLHRKRLANIVFGDAAKRKTLEGLIHPAIFEAYEERVRALEATAPHGIVQACVPLLMEKSLQPMFHKILVVYIPRKEQARRLARRDKISLSEAYRIINSQMPIDEKVSQADFVINNYGSLEDTRAQVEKTWQMLIKIQCGQTGRHP